MARTSAGSTPCRARKSAYAGTVSATLWNRSRTPACAASGSGASGTGGRAKNSSRSATTSMTPSSRRPPGLPSAAGVRHCATDYIGARGDAGRGGEVRVVTGVDQTVRGSVGLEAPALGERSRVDRVVADRVEELRDRRLRLCVVARDRERAAVGDAGRAGQRLEVL